MKPKTTTKRAGRKPAAGAPQKVRGNISPAEIKPLILEAKAAFAAQVELANIDPATDFDEWRAVEVNKAVPGRHGLSQLDSDHFSEVMAHFAELAGHDELALKHRLKSGQVKDHGPEGDTHEKRRQLAHLICQALADHIALAEISIYDLAAKTEDTAKYQQLQSARAAILAHKSGAIREGFVVFLARQKTKRPTLTLGADLKAGLADRLDVSQLLQLLYTLRNRIATREGRADPKKRAPGTARRKATKKAKAAALDTPAGTAHRKLALPPEEDPF
jgi:hypothetical protein